MSKDELITEWRSSIKRIYDNWINIFTDYSFIESVRIGIIKSYGKKDVNWDYFGLGSFYFTFALCLFIRREVDKDSRSLSLVNLLDSIYNNNDLYAINDGHDLFSDKSDQEQTILKGMYNEIWLKFIDNEDDKVISKQIIKSKIEKLEEVCEKTRLISNKLIAHRNREQIELEIKYGEIWDAANYILNEIENLSLLLDFTKYTSRIKTPQYNKYKHLRIPWWKSSFDDNQEISVEKEEFGEIKPKTN